jgi:hypothetical protein
MGERADKASTKMFEVLSSKLALEKQFKAKVQVEGQLEEVRGSTFEVERTGQD